MLVVIEGNADGHGNADPRDDLLEFELEVLPDPRRGIVGVSGIEKGVSRVANLVDYAGLRKHRCSRGALNALMPPTALVRIRVEKLLQDCVMATQDDLRTTWDPRRANCPLITFIRWNWCPESKLDVTSSRIRNLAPPP